MAIIIVLVSHIRIVIFVVSYYINIMIKVQVFGCICHLDVFTRQTVVFLWSNSCLSRFLPIFVRYMNAITNDNDNNYIYRINAECRKKIHYSDVIMSAMASQITGVSFAQPFVQAQIRESIKSLRHWPLWWEPTGDWWIPLTKGRNAENVSMWWRHHIHVSKLTILQ